MKSQRTAEQSRRHEVAWAWLSLITLVICWDRAARLDERGSAPRVRIAHAVEREDLTPIAAAAARPHDF